MSTRAAPVAGSHFHSRVCFPLLQPGDSVEHSPAPPGPGQALPALSALMRGALDVALVAATTRVSHATVLRALGSIAWPCGSASAAPAARAASGTRPRLQLGMAISRSRGPCLSKHTESRPRLTKLLATYVHQHLPELAFASLALAHSSEAGGHEDPNTGDTAVIALGPFTGGRLWTYNLETDCVTTRDVHNKFRIFDARLPHGTCKFAGGPRYTITAYRHRRSLCATPKTLARKLRALGFRLPAAALVQALPDAPPLTRPARLAKARAAWRRYCKRGGGQPDVTQPGRKPGEHRASVWLCPFCGASGVQHAGRPRATCGKKKCKLANRRARRARALSGAQGAQLLKRARQ